MKTWLQRFVDSRVDVSAELTGQLQPGETWPSEPLTGRLRARVRIGGLRVPIPLWLATFVFWLAR